MRPILFKSKIPLLFYILTTAVAVFSFTGCAPLISGKPAEGLLAPSGDYDSVRARAHVKFKGEGVESMRGKAAVVAKSPDLFRVELFGPFNQVMAIFVGDGKNVYSSVKGRESLTPYGRQRAEFSIDARDLVSILLSRVGGPGSLSDYDVGRDDLGRVVSIIKYNGGVAVIRAALGDYREAGSAQYPFKINIESGAEMLEIEYLQVELGGTVERALFEHPLSR